MESAQASIECVNRACDQIATSKRLQEVLRAVLATGNALNAGTPRANADGVKLESLLKMADVKVHMKLSAWCNMRDSTAPMLLLSSWRLSLFWPTSEVCIVSIVQADALLECNNKQDCMWVVRPDPPQLLRKWEASTA